MHLFGSLSATGKGHGTERAALAGLLGKEPATVDPLFLDEMKEKPDQSYPLKLGDKTFNLSLADIIYDEPKGEFPHPNTMTCQLMAGDKPVSELEYYSPGGGFYEWKGYTPPKKGQPKYPYETMKELRQHAEKNNLSIAQVIMANELKAEAILVFTRRGNMARWTGWMRPRYSQIYAMCEKKDVAEGLALNWGVNPFVIEFDHENPERTIELALRTLLQQKRLHKGNTVVVISSISAGEQIVHAVQMRVV